jgi:hypothetical protein
MPWLAEDFPLQGDYSGGVLYAGSRGSRSADGLAGLFLAVLTGALRDLSGHLGWSKYPARNAKRRREAHCWLMSDPPFTAHALFSPESICDELNIDLADLRLRYRRGEKLIPGMHGGRRTCYSRTRIRSPRDRRLLTNGNGNGRH